MRPPRLVDEQEFSGIVRDAGDLGEVGRNAVVRRRDDVDRGEIRVLRERRATVSGVTQWSMCSDSSTSAACRSALRRS